MKKLEILDGIFAIDKALWIVKEKILIIADLHIGYEEVLNKEGILVPRNQFKELKREIKRLLDKTKPSLVIINGDLKHEFGEISRQEWHETLAILDLLVSRCKEVILIKGNHDTILEPIAKIKGIKIVDLYCFHSRKICVVHGHKIVLNQETRKAETIIIAHEHPAISLREGFKVETYKCFLLGKWNSKNLIVMPSFVNWIEGSDVLREKLLSPFLKEIKNFSVFIIGDKIYNFGKLKNI
jgi:hypothetical protein